MKKLFMNKCSFFASFCSNNHKKKQDKKLNCFSKVENYFPKTLYFFQKFFCPRKWFKLGEGPTHLDSLAEPDLINTLDLFSAQYFSFLINQVISGDFLSPNSVPSFFKLHTQNSCYVLNLESNGSVRFLFTFFFACASLNTFDFRGLFNFVESLGDFFSSTNE